MRRWTTILAVLATIVWGGSCSLPFDNFNLPDMSKADSVSDLASDLSADVPGDSLEDLWTDAPLDTTPDLVPDVLPDAEPDVAPDVPADAVVPPGAPAAFVSTPNELAIEGSEYRYQAVLSMPGTPAFELLEGPDGMVLGQSGGLRFTPASEHVGEYPVTIQATLGDDVIVQSYVLNVRNVVPKASQTLGSAGGTISTSSDDPAVDGMAVVIPQGALPGDVNLTIGTLDAPVNLPGLAPSDVMKPMVLGPAGTAFKKPVMIQIPYDPTLDGIASTLRVYVFQEDVGDWTTIPVSKVDYLNHVLLVSSNHFSVYQPGAPALELDPVLLSYQGMDDCTATLAAEVSMSKELAELSVDAVTGLTPDIRADVIQANGVEDIEALALDPAFHGSLRTIWAYSLWIGEVGSSVVLDSTVRVVTLVVRKDGTVRLTVTNAAGDAFLDLSYPSLADSWNSDIQPLLMGENVLARMEGPAVLNLSVDVNLYISYKPGDAALMAVSPSDFGALVTGGASPSALPSAPAGGMEDLDCDGVVDLVDPNVTAGQPALEGFPTGSLTVAAGTPVELTCTVDGAIGDETVYWGSNVDSDELSPQTGGVVSFTATEVGNHKAFCAVDNAGVQSLYTFSINVQAPVVGNTQPVCAISVANNVIVLGDSTSLTASVHDLETPASAVEAYWGLYNGTNLEVDPSVSPFNGKHATFAPTEPGLHQVACRAFDGELFGPVATALVEVVQLDQNLPPVSLVLVPFFATVEVGETVTLTASALDPEGMPLTFEWISEGSLSETFTDVNQSSAEFLADIPGIVDVNVTVSDGINAPLMAYSTIVVLPPIPTMDGDGDGYEPGNGPMSDCDDANSFINPAAGEVCNNGVDENCNGEIDEGCAPLVLDSDFDGVPDALDNCPITQNPAQSDTDGDGIGDKCDADADNDGLANTQDNCPYTANHNQADLDSDGHGDVCDADDDGDGVVDADDNCPEDSNPGQEDSDNDGVGNVCECTNASTCDDSNPCTVDSCSDAGCVHTPYMGNCTDGNPCTTNDSCENGLCIGTAKDCDDQNACTDDLCEPGTGACQHVDNEVLCDDGNGCTVGDVCLNGACVGGETDCDDGNPCTSDTCNPDGGGCENTPIPGPCDDMNACTDGDTCFAGECTGTPADCSDSNVCTQDSCEPSGDGCVHTNVAGPCNDGNGCTEDDQCAAGVCVGMPKACNDSNPCTMDSCDAESGECVFSATSGMCTDGNTCTTGDQCQDGVCMGNPVDCSDGDSCTEDICENGIGCLHNDLGQVAGDNCCHPGDTAAEDSDCSPMCGDGACTGDEDSCNCAADCGDEACGNGICCEAQGEKPGTCPDDCGCVPNCGGIECGDDGCGGTCGSCPAGWSCLGGVCDAGCSDECVPGATECADLQTLMVCEPVGECFGWVYTECAPPAECVQGVGVGAGEDLDADGFTEAEGDCNDNNASIYPGAPELCDGFDNDCDDDLDEGCQSCATADECPESTACVSYDCVDSLCVANNAANMTDCDDANACTQGDVCINGVCSGMQANCNDSNPCTLDSCNTAVGCTHELHQGMCNDGDPCTYQDVCGANGCQGTPLECDFGWTCQSGECLLADWDEDGIFDIDDNCLNVYNPDQSDVDFNGIGDACECVVNGDCSSESMCLEGVCDAEFGCLFVDANCDDENPCTIDTCDEMGGCFHSDVGKIGGDGCCHDGDTFAMDSDCGGGSCGDGTCDGTSEDTCNCPADCGQESCGNGLCCLEASENGDTCPADCDPPLVDLDSDGYGSIASGGDDCDDNNPFVNPGMAESCNGRDDDCSGGVDEAGAVGCSVYYADVDHDGFGDAANSKCLCSPSGQYTAMMANDCDDGNSSVNPVANEVCDSIDNDCNGTIDDGYDLMNDVMNCGACGYICNLPHAGMEFCVAGFCEIAFCDSGYSNCDDDHETGCEFTGDECPAP